MYAIISLTAHCMQHFYLLSQDGESITTTAAAGGRQQPRKSRQKCSVIAEPIYQQHNAGSGGDDADMFQGN